MALVDPVEINAGQYYLRSLRADERLDDRPAVLEAFQDAEMLRWVTNFVVDDLTQAGDYVALRTAQWARDERCSWAVAEPTTGDLLGEVGLMHLDLTAGTAEASCWTHPKARGRGVAADALGAALRYGFGALGLREVVYGHAEGNVASRRVAEKCGFVRLDRTITERVRGEDRTMLLWSIVNKL